VEVQKRTFEIIEFTKPYQEQVVMLITQVLKDQHVISKDVIAIDDEDLFRIPEIYSGRGRFWIAIENDTVVGTVAIREVDKNTAKLHRMFVLTQYHGKGVGPALLQHAIEFAKQQGYKEIILNTHHLMHRAHRFYEKNGFTRIGDTADKFSYKLLLQQKQGGVT
jgi:GNAT superfamily N-acetyltransferase